MVQSIWQRAASFAARAHAGQHRSDDRTPYIAHPVRVALVVRQNFGCEDEVAIAAALLHDTIEDTPTDYDEIHEQFGPEVADCVAALTKNMLLPYERREADYDARLRAADWRARLIKLADVYDNLSESLDARTRDVSVGQDRPVPNAMVKKLLPRAQRAIELARADEPRAETARAVAAVWALLLRSS
jgi:(p)ppGpp synthase/HD superfamily hydrolase